MSHLADIVIGELRLVDAHDDSSAIDRVSKQWRDRSTRALRERRHEDVVWCEDETAYAEPIRFEVLKSGEPHGVFSLYRVEDLGDEGNDRAISCCIAPLFGSVSSEDHSTDLAQIIVRLLGERIPGADGDRGLFVRFLNFPQQLDGDGQHQWRADTDRALEMLAAITRLGGVVVSTEDRSGSDYIMEMTRA